MQPETESARLSEVIGSIYDCVLDVRNWPTAIERIAELIDATSGFLCRVNVVASVFEPLARWGGSDTWNQLLDDGGWAEQMPLTPYLPRVPLLQPFTVDMAARALSLQDPWQSSFAEEWMQPSGVGDVLMVVIMRAEHRLLSISMMTQASQPRFNQRTFDRLSMVLPHVRKALMLAEYVDSRNLTISTYERLLDALETPILAVDARGRVRLANAAANRMLQERDGLMIAGDVVQWTGDTSGGSTLHEAVARVAAGGSAGGESMAIQMSSGDVGAAHLVPLPQRGMGRRVPAGASVAIVISTDRDTRGPVSALARLYALTETETLVLEKIAAGHNRAETARQLNVADSTIKTHLGHIFAKTGMSTQIEIRRTCAALVAPVNTS